MEQEYTNKSLHLISSNSVPSAVHMLGIKEISSLTGVSEHHIRILCKTNQIRHIRAGTKYLINYEKFIEYLNGK